MEHCVFLTADRMPLVRDIGWNQTTAPYTHPDRTLPYDVFIYVAEGSMHVIEDGTSYLLAKGEHLFLKNGLHHWGLPKTSPGTAWFWIHFTVPAVAEENYRPYTPLLEAGHLNVEHYNYRLVLPKRGSFLPHTAFSSRLLSLLADYRQHQTHHGAKISMKVYELFLDLQHASESQIPEHSVSANNAIAGRVITYLTANIESDFEASELSDHLGLNYSYVSSAFKRLTGQRILEVHTKLRMNRAIDLMRNTSMNMTEISERLGYKNPYYFSRVFKKVLGEAPSAYLRHLYKS